MKRRARQVHSKGGTSGLMFERALLAFLACPGIVAIFVPLAWLAVTSHTQLVQPMDTTCDA